MYRYLTFFGGVLSVFLISKLFKGPLYNKMLYLISLPKADAVCSGIKKLDWVIKRIPELPFVLTSGFLLVLSLSVLAYHVFTYRMRWPGLRELCFSLHWNSESSSSCDRECHCPKHLKTLCESAYVTEPKTLEVKTQTSKSCYMEVAQVGELLCSSLRRVIRKWTGNQEIWICVFTLLFAGRVSYFL